MQSATITILGEVEARNITTQRGPKTLYAQRASLETEAMRIMQEVEVDSPNKGYRVGDVFDWDIAADLVPGRFGVELARRKTLRPQQAKPALVAAKAG
jgi:hypothetical protein